MARPVRDRVRAVYTATTVHNLYTASSRSFTRVHGPPTTMDTAHVRSRVHDRVQAAYRVPGLYTVRAHVQGGVTAV